jgi:pimeloyl-ACP methyl ester carboxylesterase
MAAAYHIVETISGREVAFRILGAGPPAVLLHESPRSSAALLPLAERLADRFTVIAMDNPGFGLSDPLAAARPHAADYADGLAEAFDALGIARAPVYGTHTGAVIALEFAHRHPARTAAVALDGFPVFTTQEQEEALASYLVPFRPDWDGTWLAWLWGRVRDQFAFFPWYRRGQGARLPRAVPQIELLQSVVNDFLFAGDNYRAAYAAAFRYAPAGAVAGARLPISYLARADDLLFGHLDRLPALPAGSEIVRLTADRDAWGHAMAAALGQGAGDASLRGPKEAQPLTPPGRIARRFVAAADGRLLARFAGPLDAPPLVLLHDSPGSSRGLEALVGHLAHRRRVIAFDLPGHGGSSPAPDDLTTTVCARWLGDALDGMKVARFDLAAFGAGAAVAATLAAMAGARIRFAALADPLPDLPSARQARRDRILDLAPRWDAGHLLGAWHCLRDGEIWKPWFDRTPAASRLLAPDPDVPRLAATLAEWMRGGPSYAHLVRAALTEVLAPRLRAIAGKASLIAFAGDPDLPSTEAIAKASGLRLRACGSLPHEVATAIEQSLAGFER